MAWSTGYFARQEIPPSSEPLKVTYIGYCHYLPSGWEHSRVQNPGGGAYSKTFHMGRLRPEVQPLTLLYTIFSEKAPLSYTFS